MRNPNRRWLYTALAFVLTATAVYQGLAAWHVIRLIGDGTAIPRQPFAHSTTGVIEAANAEARAAGAQPGDRIEDINGRAFTAGAVLRDALQQARPGDLLVTGIQHPNGTRARAAIRLAPVLPRPATLRTWLFSLTAHVIVPALCLILGGFVVLARPGDPTAWLLLATLVSFSAANPLAGWQAPGYPFALLFEDWAGSTFGLWIFLLGVRFPESSPARGRLFWWKWSLLAPLTAMLSLAVIGDFASYWSFRSVAVLGNVPSLASALQLPVSLAGALSFLAAIAWKMVRAQSADARRRLRVILAGTAVSFAPTAALIVAGLIRGRGPFEEIPAFLALPSILLMGLFPATLAYAIVVRRAMDVRVIVRQGVQYALAQRGIAILRYTTCIGAFGAILLVAASPNVSRSTLIRTIAVSACIVILVQQSLLEWLRVWVDRRFFRDAYNAEQILENLRCERCSTPCELATATLEGIRRGLHVESGFAVLKDTAEHATLTAALKGFCEPVPIHREAGRSWMAALSPADRAYIEAAGVEVLLPFTAVGELLGFLALGARRGEQPYSGMDLALLQSVAAHASLALENLNLLSNLAAEAEERVAIDAANRAKSEFLARMSHELRTPLNAIIGYSEMLQEEAEDLSEPGFINDLGKIHSAGKHLLDLINSVLDISKIEAGKMELYLETFSVNQMVRDVAGMLQPLVAKNGNSLRVELPATTTSMHADAGKLRQTLINLLSNASKFTQQGVVTFTAGAVDGSVVFRVRDTGMGMTPEQMSRLFRPFQQADASISGKYGGTGLGLAICKHFTEMMGGSISVESEPGVGTTFTVALPSAVVDSKREEQYADSAACGR